MPNLDDLAVREAQVLDLREALAKMFTPTDGECTVTITNLIPTNYDVVVVSAAIGFRYADGTQSPIVSKHLNLRYRESDIVISPDPSKCVASFLGYVGISIGGIVQQNGVPCNDNAPAGYCFKTPKVDLQLQHSLDKESKTTPAFMAVNVMPLA